MLRLDEETSGSAPLRPIVSVIEDAPSGALLFSLEDIKIHLRLEIDEDAEDPFLKRVTGAATEWVEEICGMSILPRTIQASLSQWATDQYPLVDVGIKPIREIVEVKYADVYGGGQKALDPAAYTVFRMGHRSLLKPVNGRWPTVRFDHDSVLITAKVGYEPVDDDYAANVPKRLQQAILLAVGDLYENREAQATSTRLDASMYVNRSFRNLIRGFR